MFALCAVNRKQLSHTKETFDATEQQIFHSLAEKLCNKTAVLAGVTNGRLTWEEEGFRTQ